MSEHPPARGFARGAYVVEPSQDHDHLPLRERVRYRRSVQAPTRLQPGNRRAAAPADGVRLDRARHRSRRRKRRSLRGANAAPGMRVRLTTSPPVPRGRSRRPTAAARRAGRRRSADFVAGTKALRRCANARSKLQPPADAVQHAGAECDQFAAGREADQALVSAEVGGLRVMALALDSIALGRQSARVEAALAAPGGQYPALRFAFQLQPVCAALDLSARACTASFDVLLHFVKQFRRWRNDDA